MRSDSTLPNTECIANAIHRIRDVRVVLAEDLASFYGKSVSAFNQAVSRNEALFEG